MEVGDEKEAPVFAGILELHEVLQGAKVVSEVELARGLDAGDEDRFHTRRL
jgi:hypothetical protein